VEVIIQNCVAYELKSLSHFFFIIILMH